MRQRVRPALVLVALLLGAFTVVYLPATAAQEATPAGAACPTTSVEENKALVTRFLEAVTSGDDAAVSDLTEEDLTYHTHTKGERQGDADGFLRAHRTSFPDATMTIELLVAETETVAAYVSWSGTLQGETVRIAGQDVSVPEGQRDAEWVGAVFFHVECGQIAEVRPVIDRFGKLRDLGVITEEHLQSADTIATPQP